MITNLSRIQSVDHCSHYRRNCLLVKKEMTAEGTFSVHQVPQDQAWRVDLVQELLAVRDHLLEMKDAGFNPKEVTTMLDAVCRH